MPRIGKASDLEDAIGGKTMEQTQHNQAKAAQIHRIVNMLLELDEVTLARMEEALKSHVDVMSPAVIVRDR